MRVEFVLKILLTEKEPQTLAAEVVGCSPDNWPTVWLSPDGSMQHRLKTNEILDDYLNKDLVHLGDSSVT